MMHRPAVRAFISQAHKRSLPPKHTLIHGGDDEQSLFLVLEGSLSVMLEDEQGREIVLSYLSPGEFCGERCLFPEQSPGAVQVRSRAPTLVAEMAYETFRSFAQEYPDIMLCIAGQLAHRLQEASQRCADLAFLDVAGRLSNALNDLTRKPDAIPHPRGKVVRISRMELARHIGCSREMAGRALKKLRNDGLVKDQGRSILVYGAPDNVALSYAA